ncbi:hypothetical protein DXV76_13965 [Rhodobacteraceae bacterium CCMM004]|nr:hypothetical protein DXV76_13965 [Rhodobacteraceae bacterium CCMM004]
MEAVLRREIARHNDETGRRSDGAGGRSYRQVFEDGLDRRVIRKATTRHLARAGLIYKPATVDRHGRVQLDTWTYGDPGSQEALLRHRGKRILVGRNPDDFSVPAVAYDEDGRLIWDRIEPVIAGDYESADGIRTATRNRKAVRDAARRWPSSRAGRGRTA